MGSTWRCYGASSPCDPLILGGVFVTPAEVNGDGRADLVTGGRGDLGLSGQGMGHFLAFDPDFRGGARAAVGDVNGDGRADLVVAAGFGGWPRVAVYDGRTVVGGPTPTRLFNDIFVFEQTLRNGVFVAAGDVDGDGFGDVLTRRYEFNPPTFQGAMSGATLTMLLFGDIGPMTPESIARHAGSKSRRPGSGYQRAEDRRPTDRFVGSDELTVAVHARDGLIKSSR